MTGCECGYGPRIEASQCKGGAAVFGKNTGDVLEAGCPPMFCHGMVAVIEAKISDHDGVVPGRGSWIGTRVVDDRVDFAPRDGTTKPGA
jgi:hypothetical protein